MTWPGPDELRVGLGCMRLPSDEDLALGTIAAALEAGITVFDTARAYDGNEALLAKALQDAPSARVVTKGGMARAGGGWIPDGRARSIRSDCESSLAALDGLPIDLYLLHAPDPRVEWRTSVRALARLVHDGLVARVRLQRQSNTARRASHLVFDWRPDGPSDDLEALAASLPAPAEWAACTHPGGPPTCWCRPPLPGLVLEFARRHSVEPARSVVVGTRPAHRTLANVLGARYVDAAR